jgi:hypothetical protein
MTQSNASLADVPDKHTGRRVRLAGYLVGIFLAVGIIAFGFWLTSVLKGNPQEVIPTPQASTEAVAAVPLNLVRPIVTEEGLVDQSGVRIVSIAATGGGGLIDLRYQVVDPDKANALLHDEKNPPTIVDEATGLVVDQLLMGHSHTGIYHAGQTYYLIFENPGNIVQSGRTVSVLLGNAEVDHVIVK